MEEIILNFDNLNDGKEALRFNNFYAWWEKLNITNNSNKNHKQLNKIRLCKNVEVANVTCAVFANKPCDILNDEFKSKAKVKCCLTRPFLSCRT